MPSDLTDWGQCRCFRPYVAAPLPLASADWNFALTAFLRGQLAGGVADVAVDGVADVSAAKQAAEVVGPAPFS